MSGARDTRRRASAATWIRGLALGGLALALGAAWLGRAQAGSEHFFAPVADARVQEECGSCHLAYPASMLPAASWRRIVAGLHEHFGEDASVDAASAAHIADWLAANAADAPAGGGSRAARRALRDLAPGAAPLRITELRWWTREHREIGAADWRDPKIGSKANCAACHVDAARGWFDD